MMRLRLISLLLISSSLLFSGCESLIRLIALLSSLAYGTGENIDLLYTSLPNLNCALGLVCSGATCVSVENNGDFEESTQGWYGDQVAVALASPACRGNAGAVFLATTPTGSSTSASAQIVHVVAYNDLIPPANRDQMRRVRARAVFFLQQADHLAADKTFRLRITAYAGDPATFPREGDPEAFPTVTSGYSLLGNQAESLLFDGIEGIWQALEVTAALPEGTDFFVVMIEAVEDNVNDPAGEEFPAMPFVDFVQIAIDGGNTPPIPSPDFGDAVVGQAVVLEVLANDEDRTSRLDAASLTIVQPPTFGIVEVLDGGRVRYTPTSSAAPKATAFTDQFAYTVADSEGEVSVPSLVTIEVRETNRPPIPQSDYFQVPPDVVSVLTPLLNDSDPDGDDFFLGGIGRPPNGTATIINNGQQVEYTPNPGYRGPDQFGYYVFDEHGAFSGEAEIQIGVIVPGNIPPVANEDAFTVAAGTGTVLNVLANDTDADGEIDPGTVRLPSFPENGTLGADPGGGVYYLPNEGFTGTDSFFYTVRDDGGATSNEATVTVTVVNP